MEIIKKSIRHHRFGGPPVRKSDFSDYIAYEGNKVLVILSWFLVNLAFCVYTFEKYTDPIEVPAVELLGWSLTGARTAAAVLNLNCGLILLPMCRITWSALHESFLRHFIPFDKNFIFHRYLAWTVGAAAVIHAFSHFRNVFILSHGQLDEVNTILKRDDANLRSEWSYAFLTVPGITGHLALTSMALMYSSALKSVRRLYFELFWYTHHLFIVFYGSLLLHGTSSMFAPPRFYLFNGSFVLLYAWERYRRYKKQGRYVKIVKVVYHPSDVIELRFRPQGFKYKSGQYLFLNVPYLSTQEWHPFTISSAPQDDYVSCHIRCAGDWTKALAVLLSDKARLEEAAALSNDRILRVDGPVGAASEEVFDYETVMLVGAGIGVTPFGSILKNMRNVIHSQQRHGKRVRIPLKKVFFYWSCRDRGAFEWFTDLISVLEEENVNNFLEIHAYLTGSVDDPTAVRKMMLEDDPRYAHRDQTTGLIAQTEYGRPNFDAILYEMSLRYPGKKIGVFFCGPPVLSKQIYSFCRKYSGSRREDCQFIFNKENF